jgi:mannose-6-phosphate isomerase-like protein (cupin superfamily)
LAASSPTTRSRGDGLIVQRSEGERRLRRQPPAGAAALATPFIIKVDRKNGGSPDFVLGYEDIQPGNGIPRHYHPHVDEILFVHGGTGLASLGSREAVVTEGATIYIPPNTRVSLKNTGTEPLSVAFFFPEPGMVDFFRDISEFSALCARHRAHIIFEER